jgi:hypothetical protein
MLYVYPGNSNSHNQYEQQQQQYLPQPVLQPHLYQQTYGSSSSSSTPTHQQEHLSMVNASTETIPQRAYLESLDEISYAVGTNFFSFSVDDSDPSKVLKEKLKKFCGISTIVVYKQGCGDNVDFLCGFCSKDEAQKVLEKKRASP